MNKLCSYALIVAIAMFATVSSSAICDAAEPDKRTSPATSFRIPQRDYQWSFPQDHAPHPGFQTEWWYYTGQLYTSGATPFRDKPRYGFQLTFFRRQESPAANAASEYLAHAALTDLTTGTTMFRSRRGGALLGAAGADPKTLEAWSGDWLAELIGDTHLLRFSLGETNVRLLGEPSPRVSLQGLAGFSSKGRCETCASHYYSIARIPFSGELRTNNHITQLTGIGWMDHEFMSNSLSAEQVGWDWMGLMLKDGRNLTVFQLRDATGRSSFTSASILRDGSSELLPEGALTLTPSEEWISPSSKGRYPLAWRIQIPAHGIDVTVRARTATCEVGDGESTLEPRYWEGPVASSDESAVGYLEMTGYAGRVRL
jgi:predicted secreted hydrolase